MKSCVVRVFGPAVGLEFAVDGGAAYFKPTGATAGGTTDNGKTFGLIAVSYALVIGF